LVTKLRGADVLAKALSEAGTRRIFTLSGNQVMSVFDACIDAAIELLHVRHEAAAVHMADAWGRLTGEPGVALVTAGPGFANTLAALYAARMAESPLVLLSGHAPRGQLGLGAFQEMAQADMARHVAKASWMAERVSGLGRDVVRALELARSGRPGPVHIAIPVDILESTMDRPHEDAWEVEGVVGPSKGLDPSLTERIIDAIAKANKPLVLAGPAMTRGAGPAVLSSLADATRVPVVCTESPRGINDPDLGAFAEVLSEADLVVLLGKKLDSTLRFGAPPAVRPDCRFVQIDTEPSVLDQTRRVLNGSDRLALTCITDPLGAARELVHMAGQREWSSSGWYDELRAAVSYRPPSWTKLESPPGGPLYTVEVCRAVQELLDAGDNAVFVSDGGEFGQWVQGCISAPNRIINGPGGAIGGAIPFALAARLALPDSKVVAFIGDGAFGFHALEFDTAVRYGLPFVALVGNDAAWNAERQIQLRDYGEGRLVGCDLLPTRYDLVVEAMGGYGEHVSSAADLRPALERALASGRPACLNVAVRRDAAPVIRRGMP